MYIKIFRGQRKKYICSKGKRNIFKGAKTKRKKKYIFKGAKTKTKIHKPIYPTDQN